MGATSARRTVSSLSYSYAQETSNALSDVSPAAAAICSSTPGCE